MWILQLSVHMYVFPTLTSLTSVQTHTHTPSKNDISSPDVASIDCVVYSPLPPLPATKRQTHWDLDFLLTVICLVLSLVATHSRFSTDIW